jgi:aryl-alcohol dehydrogenase-like predicted oxidoreductase
MEKRKLGKTDLEVSVLGFGGWEIGFANTPQAEVASLLNSAIDSELNLIDTAAAYFESEKLIGKAIATRRSEVVLLSKCGALDGFSRYDWSKKGVLETIETSLRNLQTEYLDIAQLHSCSAEILRQADCIEGLIRAQERGYTRYVGYSGDNEHAAYAIGMNFFDTLQTSVSIADQSPVEGNIKLAHQKQLGIIAKRPVANVAWRTEEKPEDSYYHDYWERLRKLQFPFLKKSLEESISMALRFTLSIEGVAAAIVGTTNQEHWEQNAKNIAEGNLSGKEFASVRERWQEIADESWIGKT